MPVFSSFSFIYHPISTTKEELHKSKVTAWHWWPPPKRHCAPPLHLISVIQAPTQHFLLTPLYPWQLHAQKRGQKKKECVMVCQGIAEGVNRFYIFWNPNEKLHVTNMDVRAWMCVKWIQEWWNQCLRETWKKRSVPKRLQQHNIRKVKMIFPAGESNISYGDRSCSSCLPSCQKSTACCWTAELNEYMSFLVTVGSTIAVAVLWQLHCFKHFTACLSFLLICFILFKSPTKLMQVLTAG